MEETVEFLLKALGILALPCVGIFILIAFVWAGILLARKHRQRWDGAWIETGESRGASRGKGTGDQA